MILSTTSIYYLWDDVLYGGVLSDSFGVPEQRLNTRGTLMMNATDGV